MSANPSLEATRSSELQRSSRLPFFLVSILLGITGGLGNSLISANLPQIQGQLSLTPTEGGWITSAYMMTNVSANLLLYKLRQQYGLRRFAEIGLSLYAAVNLLHLTVHNLPMAIAARVFSGFSAAVISSLATLYMVEVFPPQQTSRAMALGLTLSQLATPLAWMLSSPLLDLGEWRTLYLFESGLALCCLAGVIAVRLPPKPYLKVFEKLDLVTFSMLAPGLALLIAVLVQGRTQWWTSRTWIAWASISAIVLIVLSAIFELYRRNPLLQIRWILTADVTRFCVSAFTLRFLLSEQSFGATGLLRTLGMGPDQLQPLYFIMLLGLLAGALISFLTISQRMLVPHLVVAVLLIAAGSYMDHKSSSLTRPHDMFFSQFLLSIAAAMFLPPMLLIGMAQATKAGANYIITFITLFSISQNFGGLAGPALLGTFQQYREQEYSASVTADVDPTRPVVSQRLSLQSGVYARQITDPVQRSAQGVGQLAQIATRESNVLAYDDVFVFTGVLAIGVMFWSMLRLLQTRLRKATS
jgi:MFS family permease